MLIFFNAQISFASIKVTATVGTSTTTLSTTATQVAKTTPIENIVVPSFPLLTDIFNSASQASSSASINGYKPMEPATLKVEKDKSSIPAQALNNFLPARSGYSNSSVNENTVSIKKSQIRISENKNNSTTTNKPPIAQSATIKNGKTNKTINVIASEIFSKTIDVFKKVVIVGIIDNFINQFRNIFAHLF